MSKKKLSERQIEAIGKYVKELGIDHVKAARLLNKVDPPNVPEAKKFLDANIKDLQKDVPCGTDTEPGPAVDVEKVMEEIRKECGKCENWSGTDCTLVNPETGCPFIETIDPEKTPKKSAELVKLIKTVKGKKYDMLANPENVETMLKDPRITKA